jgi:phytoene dehydrogenase-like protein
MTEPFFDVAVVGGGLGGLTTAALLARRGLGVVVLERAGTLGGRAATHLREGFCFNRGAHALYRAGAAARVLRGLGVRWTGSRPPADGIAELDGRPHALPATFTSLLTTRLLGWSAKVQGARLLARLGSLDLRPLRGVTLDDWLDTSITDETLRLAIEAFIRVATYSNAASLLDAGAALEQLRLAQRSGVTYVDGGWQTLVDGVAAAAQAAGASVRGEARVTCAIPSAEGWTVSLGDASLACRGLVLATGPETARSLVASDALATWANQAIPVRAACLDVALSTLPCPRTTFALGVDQPLYFSVHSRTARVAPDGAALVSTMKYLSPSVPQDAPADAAELEAWLDRLQPGWRRVLVERQWLPTMVASNALTAASGGGTAGRPGPRVPDAPGLFVVGDWVGSTGMLLDASVGSAEQAAAELGDWLAVGANLSRVA